MKKTYKYAALGCPITAQDLKPGVIYDSPCEERKNHQSEGTMKTTMNMIQSKVVDENNVSMVGTTVQNISQSSGTISNVNGVFNIEAGPDDIIQISYVGFKTLRFKASEMPSVIRLAPSVESLNEVIVVAPPKVSKKPSLKSFIKENQAWIMVGLSIISIGVAIYYQNKQTKKQRNDR